MYIYNLLQILAFFREREGEREREKAKCLPDIKITSRWISKLKKRKYCKKIGRRGGGRGEQRGKRWENCN